MKSMKKRFAALFCAAAMVVSGMPAISPTMTAEAQVLDGLSALGRQVAAEGGVLVKNADKVLPLKKDTTVSVFGRMQDDYYSSGIGSGGEVRERYTRSILYGIENCGKLKVNTDLKKTYQDWNKANPKQGANNNWNSRPWSYEEMQVTKDIANDAKSKSDAAVIVLARTSGEDRDIQFQKGGYLLTDREEEMIKNVSETFDKTIVVLNTTNIIDMSWVEKYPQVDSIIYGWNGGQDGGCAVADLLTGDVNPSGKLTDTIAKDYTQYPSYKNYGTNENYYQEDIYVGYRYFETFAQNDVAYPFGYGLSYTTFDITTDSVTVEGDYINVVVSVLNTGDVAGKEVVQVYYGAPQTKLGNPLKELAAFAKTRELQPGESQNISLKFKIADMASYDDGGAYQESAYILEAGDYKIYVGNDVRSSKLVYTYNQPQWKVTEQLTEAAAPIKDFTRYKAVEKDGVIVREEETVPKLKVNVEQKIKDNMPQELTQKDDGQYTLKDVYDGKLTVEQFVAQMTNEQMGMLSQGSVDVKDSYTKGVASTFGGVRAKDNDGKNLIYMSELYGIPVVTCADGPAGVRMSDYATQLPCGNAIGCTWNLDLIQELYELEGQEMVLNNVDNLLGPGVNIHRDPRCGRNFEYFSEDPLLSGRMSAAIVKGVQSTGATVTAKHFACNNEECNSNGGSNRGSADAIVSERALREIYLKVFEIYVKEGNAQSLMTAYNPVNGCWSASNYDLNTEILRNEWGFTGIVMTDWWGKMSDHAWADGKRTHADTYVDTMIRAQNDIWMTCEQNPYDANGNVKNRNKINYFLNGIKNGTVTRAEMQRSAVNLCGFILKTQAFSRKYNTDFTSDVANKFYKPGEDWFTVEQAQLGNPQVTGITVGGRKVTSFNQNIREYKVYTPASAATFPTVAATAEAGTTVVIEQATADKRTAVIKATEQKATLVYRIVFTDEENLTPPLENSKLASISDIKVNGKAINGFDPGVKEYSVAVASLASEPEITWTAPEGILVTKTYDSANKTAKIVAASADQAISYKLKFGVAPQSDEFDGTSLQNFWTVTNENKEDLSLADGHLVIGAKYGSIWQTQNHLKNQVIQSAYGDWVSVTKIDLPKLPSLAYQSLGVIAMQDQDNYIYVKMAYEGDHLEIAFCQEGDAKISTLEKLSDADTQKFTNAMYVKLTKLGDTYMAAVSPDGKDYIRFATSATAEYEEPKFMFVNGNGDKDLPEVLEAKIDYVRFETENIGDTVNIGADTKLKAAETAPIAISAGLKPATCQDTDGGLYLTGSGRDEYITYSINVEKSGYYDVIARIASPESNLQQVTFNAYLDNKLLAGFFSNGTGGEQSWVDLPGHNVELTEGTHTLKLVFDTSGLNLNWLQFKLTEETANLTAAREALTQAVAAAKDKYETGQGDYTDDSWKVFKEAYEKAANPAADATVDELNDLKAKLEEAKQGLTIIETPPTETETPPTETETPPTETETPPTETEGTGNPAAAKAELDKVVGEVKAKYEAGQGDYTDESWKKFEDAYKAATSPAANATAVELLELRDKLAEAERLLVKKGPDQTETNLGTEAPKLAAPTIKSAKASASPKYVSVKVKINAVTGADRYEVYRVVGSKASLVGTTKSGQTSLKDTKVTKRTVSYYAVAVSADGKVKSDKGASYKVTLAKAPKIKKVSSAGNGIKIEWKKNSSAKKYVVYRSTKKNSGYARVATVKKGRTYYVDRKAKKGKKYYYKVAVVTKKQASLMSKASKSIKR